MDVIGTPGDEDLEHIATERVPFSIQIHNLATLFEKTIIK
jgi:hypothetical protein